MDILDDMGVSKLSAKVFFFLTTPLKVLSAISGPKKAETNYHIHLIFPRIRYSCPPHKHAVQKPCLCRQPRL